MDPEMLAPKFEIVPGFYGDAILRDLTRAEILERGLPLIWHGEFTKDLPVQSQFAGAFSVPKGFITDGASVPRPLWQLLSATDPDILYPSYAHDLIYSLRGKLPNVTLNIYEADEVIRELMRAIGAPLWKREMVFAVLRAHNGATWPGISSRKLATIKLERV